MACKTWEICGIFQQKSTISHKQPKEVAVIKKILFVCVENSCRSQIAEAFAKLHGKEICEALSAGSKPSGRINTMAVQVMNENGYDLTTHQSKSLGEIPQEHYEYSITMGCGDDCPLIDAGIREDWAIPDPKNFPLGKFREVRDLIEIKVKDLLERIAAVRD